MIFLLSSFRPVDIYMVDGTHPLYSFIHISRLNPYLNEFKESNIEQWRSIRTVFLKEVLRLRPNSRKELDTEVKKAMFEFRHEADESKRKRAP